MCESVYPTNLQRVVVCRFVVWEDNIQNSL